MLKIGEKIKELREKKNITQNKIAEYLGITEQAISRWENGGGYPDMELIPAISNFLNISIDELFEADKKAERLQKIRLNITLKYGNGFIDETIELCRNALKEFANDYFIMYNLFVALGDWKLHENKDEIIELSERIMSDCDDYNIKMQTIYKMASFYIMIDDDKVKNLAEQLPTMQFGINISKEKLLGRLPNDINERAKHKKRILWVLGTELSSEIDSLADFSPPNERIEIREKALQIMNILFDDGDYSVENMNLHKIYRKMSEDYLCLGKQEQALDCLEKSADYCIAVENSSNVVLKHTSLLFKDMENHVFIYNHGSPATISYLFINNFLLKSDVYAPIREHERFKAVIAKLEQYAKIEKSE